MIEIAIPLPWVSPALAIIALAGLGLGLLSAITPQKSIALYKWLMGRFNWRVEPIDQAREFRTTPVLGILMVALAGAILLIGLKSKLLALPW